MEPRDDTAASTPSPRQTSDKPGSTMADTSAEAGSSSAPGTPLPPYSVASAAVKLLMV